MECFVAWASCHIATTTHCCYWLPYNDNRGNELCCAGYRSASERNRTTGILRGTEYHGIDNAWVTAIARNACLPGVASASQWEKHYRSNECWPFERPKW